MEGVVDEDVVYYVALGEKWRRIVELVGMIGVG
jgi:hypothetical protein